jgi:hypothetical protein
VGEGWRDSELCSVSGWTADGDDDFLEGTKTSVEMSLGAARTRAQYH